ncbi:MAG TPA: ABC transporter substrate-binding protein [Gaiellaceae bacterium]|nr:ABC transporter substrate-binding protein [Gaiellaceae bacterium]
MRSGLRICSLLPSATEIVGDLGLTEQLVGRSAECDWPPEVRSLPVVTAARLDTAELASAEIDEAVRGALADGRSLYALDEALIASLAPDVIVTQDLCAVCAVSSSEVRAVCGLDAETISLDPHTIREIQESVLLLAQRFAVEERGRRVVEGMRATIEEASLAVAGQEPRRVVVLEWLDPPFVAGHWLPEMVAAAGGVDLLGRAGEPSRTSSWDEVFAAAPELVVLAPCGFDAARAIREAARLGLPARLAASAIASVAVDANAFFSRPAPRVAEGVAQLALLFHPHAIDADRGPATTAATPRTV